MTRRISPDTERGIMKAYAEGKTSREVAALFNVSQPTVLNCIHRNGGKVRPPGHDRLSPKMYSIIKFRYLEKGEPGTAIATDLGIDSKTVYNVVRSMSGKVRPDRRYTLNEGFFDSIDSEEKAYWLGFIAGDGCISYDKLVVQLQRRDREHLIKLRSALDADHPIQDLLKEKNAKMLPQSRIEIYSPHLTCGLIKLGITPHKSLTLRPPELAPEFRKHFWRGEIDADGCISIQHSKHHRKRIQITLLGSRLTVFAFADFVNQFAASLAVPHQTQGKIWYVAYGGIQLPQRILHELYDGANVFLDRKLKRAQQALAIENLRPRRIVEPGERVYKLYQAIGTWNGTARALRYSISSATSLKRIYYKYCKEQGLPCQQD